MCGRRRLLRLLLLPGTEFYRLLALVRLGLLLILNISMMYMDTQYIFALKINAGHFANPESGQSKVVEVQLSPTAILCNRKLFGTLALRMDLT